MRQSKYGHSAVPVGPQITACRAEEAVGPLLRVRVEDVSEVYQIHVSVIIDLRYEQIATHITE